MSPKKGPPGKPEKRETKEDDDEEQEEVEKSIRRLTEALAAGLRLSRSDPAAVALAGISPGQAFELGLALGLGSGVTGGAAGSSTANPADAPSRANWNRCGTPGVGTVQSGGGEPPEETPSGSEGPGEKRFYAVWRPEGFEGPYFGRWGAVRAYTQAGGECWGKRCSSEDEARAWLVAHHHLAASQQPLRIV